MQSFYKLVPCCKPLAFSYVNKELYCFEWTSWFVPLVSNKTRLCEERLCVVQVCVVCLHRESTTYIITFQDILCALILKPIREKSPAVLSGLGTIVLLKSESDAA